MGSCLNNGDCLWFKHLETDESSFHRLYKLKAGSRIRVEIDGVVGHWVRMDDGADGRPTPGIRPITQAKKHWKSLIPRRGERLEFKLARHALAKPAVVQVMTDEWKSAEDEAAFHNL